jgi:dihydroorotate dehydrogenase electron transfer subunit
MPGRDQFLAIVGDNKPLCREHFRLVLKLPAFPPTEPGQFIQVACHDPAEELAEREREWSANRPVEVSGTALRAPLAMLRRPFSLAGRRDTGGGVELELIHRVVGVGTDWLSRLKAGDEVSILGPLGNRFPLPKDDELAVLVGGGVGIPPMLYLAERLGRSGARAVAFAGATTLDLLPLTVSAGLAPAAPDRRRASFERTFRAPETSGSAPAATPQPPIPPGPPPPVRSPEEAAGDAPATVGGADPLVPAPRIDEFARHGIDSVITTDDGSYGFRGFVTQALERFLDAHVGSPSPRLPVIYTCGPELMMRRVATIAAERGLECHVAVERAMACGMGTCQSCCIRVRKPDPSQPPLPGSDWC